MSTGVIESMRALGISADDYRILLDESSDPIFKLDVEGRYQYVNFEFAKAMGRTQAEIIGNTLWDIFPKDEADKRLEVLRHVYATGETLVFPARVPNPAGDLHFITTAKALFNDRQQVIAVICVSKNITALKRAEDAERDAHQRLQVITDAIPGVVYQFMRTNTGEWKFIYLSKGVEALFEIRAEDALKDASLMTQCIVPEDRESHRESVERSFREMIEWEHWHRIRTASGAMKWVRGRASPHMQGDGSVIWTGILVDVTERKQIEDAALASSRAKSEFLANMSHEIRTPLSAISGMAKIIRSEPLTSTQRVRMDKLEVAVNHLNLTINDILDLSKIEANKLVLEKGPVLIQALFDNVASMVHTSLEHKRLQLNVEIDPMPRGLVGDATRLGQALLNYAGNAIKFTDAGSITMRASVLEEAQDSVLLRLEVQDTGVGISADKHHKLFEAFVQADSTTTRKYGGSGLGLAITKRFVEAMGGEVGFESEAGKGSTFWLTARLAKDSACGKVSTEASPINAEAILQTTYAGKRVLLVEDDEFNREIGVFLLREVGMVVDEAEDGRVAVEMTSRGNYDLVFMDMQMPELDGIDATRQIRASSTGKSVPIVAMTANAFSEDKLCCMEAGMNEFITKPVDPTDLYEIMLRMFQRPTH